MPISPVPAPSPRGPGGRSLPPSLAKLVTAALLLSVPAAHAQTVRRTDGNRFFEMRVVAPAPHYGRRPMTPLTPANQDRLNRFRVAREAGQAAVARDSLRTLIAEVPHHPLVLVELAQCHEALRAWPPLEAMARAERTWSRDSVLLSQDLVLALERQGRTRDAGSTVLETVVADPQYLEWARGWLDSLSGRDPRGIRDLVRRTAAMLRDRVEVVRLAAALEWRFGDASSAMKLLAEAEARGQKSPLRWMFAEELLQRGAGRDSMGAVEVMLELAADRSAPEEHRVMAARRGWDVASARGASREAAPRVAAALKDVPAERWGSPLVLAVMRGLREGGATEASRGLMRALDTGGQALPEVELERALGVLSDGPPEQALPGLRALANRLPEAMFHYAEALFFAGEIDSAHAWHERVAADPLTRFAGTSFERLYLIEDSRQSPALRVFARMAYEQWRGESKHALGLADSLYRSLTPGPLWAQAALTLATLRETLGDGKAALEPLLAVAEKMSNDRLAPVARQRAGDNLRIWHKDEARALEQYEECLARYPKAWNAPEVRRWAEALRRARRF